MPWVDKVDGFENFSFGSLEVNPNWKSVLGHVLIELSANSQIEMTINILFDYEVWSICLLIILLSTLVRNHYQSNKLLYPLTIAFILESQKHNFSSTKMVEVIISSRNPKCLVINVMIKLSECIQLCLRDTVCGYLNNVI